MYMYLLLALVLAGGGYFFWKSQQPKTGSDDDSTPDPKMCQLCGASIPKTTVAIVGGVVATLTAAITAYLCCTATTTTTPHNMLEPMRMDVLSVSKWYTNPKCACNPQDPSAQEYGPGPEGTSFKAGADVGVVKDTVRAAVGTTGGDWDNNYFSLTCYITAEAHQNGCELSEGWVVERKDSIATYGTYGLPKDKVVAAVPDQSAWLTSACAATSAQESTKYNPNTNITIMQWYTKNAPQASQGQVNWVLKSYDGANWCAQNAEGTQWLKIPEYAISSPPNKTAS